jgi:outer membrane receptor protein involved in Fe transport
MPSLIRCLIAAALVAFATPAHATPGSEEEELAKVYGGEEFISIATGRRQPLSRAPAVGTVITAEDIEAMGATNLDEVLETVAGLHVSLSSARFSPIYSIRGIRTNTNPQVLMLINGIPITQLNLGGRGEQNSLPVNSIERVEVIRGPGSAVYGADAFAGVINVVTKTAADIHGTEVGGRGGSFDSEAGWLLHGGQWAGFDLAFTVEWSSTDGDRDRIIERDAQNFFDSIFGTHASLAPGPADTRGERLDTRLDLHRGDWRVRLWNWKQMDLGVGPGVALALDPSGRGDIDNYLADITYHKPDLARDWDFTAQASYLDVNTESRQRLFPPGTILPIGADGNVNPLEPVGLVQFPNGLIGNPAVFERHYRLDLSTFYTGIRNHRLRLGAGLTYAKLDSEETKNFGPGVIDGSQPVVDGRLTDVTNTPFVFIEPHDRFAYYGSLQDEWSFAPDWELTGGVRFDRYSDFGNTVNPRLALVWQTRYNLSTKLLYGRAFRAPSFAELFNINNPVALGNPKLGPETINTIELAFDYQPRVDLRTLFNVYAYRIDDLIEFVSNAGGTSATAQNTGAQTGHGLEVEADWRITDQLRATGNYALQRVRDDRTGHDTGDYPRSQLYLRTDWSFAPSWHVDAQFNWVMDRQRTLGDPRRAIADYSTVDLTLRRKKVAEHWDFSLSVRNLFDEHGFEPSPVDVRVPGGSLVPGDFPLPGRSFYGEVRYRF